MGKVRFYAALCTSLFGFFAISKLLFDKVYLTSKIVIDEEFHIPQGLAYCNFTFDTWNPKITTLPGLYLVSALVLGPFQLCSAYWLRFLNLVAAVVNLWLFYICFKLHNGKRTSWTDLFASVNVSLLPPLYFFGHVYYTDVISITFILLLIIFNRKDRHFLASIFGMSSVLMRQTNIIWVTMIFGQYALKEAVSRTRKKSADYDVTSEDVVSTIWNLKNGLALKKFPLSVWLNIASYSAVLISFLFFVVVNGSVVVGDKTAHTASLHLPQLFYFVLFCLAFGWQYFLAELVDFLKSVSKSKALASVIWIGFALVIYLNTLEHPYLLADNRHYTFYIWSRFYRKYFWFRYLMIPVYHFGFFALFSNIYAKHYATFVLTYLACTTLVLIPQQMIEIRYFLIPYIFLRLQFKNVPSKLITEFLFYCTLNILTFYIFFTKDIYWPDYNYVQTIIW